MNWYVYVLLFLMAAALVVYIIFYNKEKKSQFKRLEQKWLQKLNKNTQDLQSNLTGLENELTQKQQELAQITQRIDHDTQYANTIRDTRLKAIEEVAAERQNLLVAQVNADIKEWAKSAQEAAHESFILTTKDYDDQIVIKQEQLKYLIEQIADWRAKQDAINEEILRRRAIEEKQDFYRIQLTDAVKEDIEILNDIRPKLSSVEIFNKFIYDNYIARPTKEMTQRVLSNRNPSGIYKVTNIQTNEIYIGKSVRVADRWQSHVKAAEGLGGVAESQFQRALKKYGVDCFTWELLEEADKDKLTEREKYYINFYNTKNFGYNQREG